MLKIIPIYIQWRASDKELMKRENPRQQGIKNLGFTVGATALCACLLQWGPWLRLDSTPLAQGTCQEKERSPSSGRSGVKSNCPPIIEKLIQRNQKARAHALRPTPSLYDRLPDIRQDLERYHRRLCNSDMIFELTGKPIAGTPLLDYAKAISTVLNDYNKLLEKAIKIDPVTSVLLSDNLQQLRKFIDILDRPNTLKKFLELSSSREFKAPADANLMNQKFFNPLSGLMGENEAILRNDNLIAANYTPRSFRQGSSHPSYSFSQLYHQKAEQALNKAHEGMSANRKAYYPFLRSQYPGLVPPLRMEKNTAPALKKYVQKRLMDKEYDLIKRNPDGNYTLVEVKSLKNYQAMIQTENKELNRIVQRGPPDQKITDQENKIRRMRRERDMIEKSIARQSKLTQSIRDFLFGDDGTVSLEIQFIRGSISPNLRHELQEADHTIVMARDIQ